MEKESLWVPQMGVPVWGDLWHHVWLIDVALDRVDGEHRQRAEALLSAAEKERAQRFRFEKDQVRHRVTHAAMREILGGYLGVAADRVEYEVGERGKPRLTSRMEWGGRRVEFNLSHSGDWALIAVSRHGEVGVDLEAHREGVGGVEIAERYFSRREVEAFLRVPEQDRARAFFDGWSRKEAYIKACGEGLYRELGSFSVEMEPGKPAKLLEVEGSEEKAGDWDMTALPVPGGYSGALVVRTGAPGGVQFLGLYRWPGVGWKS